MMYILRFLRKIGHYSISKPKKIWADHDAFGKHLLFTNTWTSGVLMIAGDLIQQEIEYQRKLQSKRYDWNRVGRMFIVGLGFGPLHHYFYGWMEKRYPRRTMRTVSVKILLDQIIMSPVCILFMFYTLGVMERKPISGCTQELKEKFAEVYTIDWLIWPPTQFINFHYIPVHYQVVYINSITMIYNIFLSYIKHRDQVCDSKLQVENIGIAEINAL